MAALKKLQAEKDSGDWESLTEQAQQQVCRIYQVFSYFLVFLLVFYPD